MCNKYLSILSLFWSSFLCSCWSCLSFFVGAPVSDSPSSFPFLSSNLSCLSLPVVFLLLGSCISSCSCVSPSPPPSFLLLCFLFFITYAILIFLQFFSASLRVSRLIVLAVVVLVIIPPLSQLVFLLLPRPPRAHLACHAARPIFERMPGSMIERLKRKKHFRTQQHIHTHIYIYIYRVKNWSKIWGF